MGSPLHQSLPLVREIASPFAREARVFRIAHGSATVVAVAALMRNFASGSARNSPTLVVPRISAGTQLPYRNNRCAVRACPRRIKMEAARHYNNPLAACPVSFVDGT